MGADLVLSFRNESEDVIQQNGNYVKTSGGGNAANEFGLQFFTGADYYIAKKVYLGVEAGLSILSGKAKDLVTESRFLSTTTSVTVEGGSTFNINTQVFGGVRIGYQF